MEMQYYDKVSLCPFSEDIRNYLIMADKEFIPPLSSRRSPTQADLTGGACSDGITDYFNSMASQPVIAAVEDGRCLGFMAFKLDHTCEQIGSETFPNFYATTCVVHPDTRGRGLMRGFYETLISLFPDRGGYTRTWHTNYAHLKILDRLGFSEIARLPNHRGPGLDTVYFYRKPQGEKV